MNMEIEGGTCLVQTGQDMREINNRVVVLINLVEDIVPEKLDDVPITCF